MPAFQNTRALQNLTGNTVTPDYVVEDRTARQALKQATDKENFSPDKNIISVPKKTTSTVYYRKVCRAPTTKKKPRGRNTKIMLR